MLSTDELAGFPLLARLTELQLQAVAALATPTSVEAGSMLIEEGRTATKCWLIRTGQVALEIPLPNDRSRTVQTLGPGDVLGWSWLIEPHRWRFDGRALGPVTAFELDAVRLREIATEDPALGYAIAVGLIETLADRLHATRARLIDLYGGPHGE